MLKKLLKNKIVAAVLFKLMTAYMFLISRFCQSKSIYIGDAKRVMANREPIIVACWHSRFLPLLTHRRYGAFHAVTSAHRDGNYLQMILEYYGHHAIRGSSRKQANSAMREILRIGSRDIRLVITPDGPLGPRFKVKGSILRVARKFKVPIMPITYSATHAIVLNTWDRFIIPLPFISKIVIMIGNPIDVQSLASEEELEKIMMEMTYELDQKCDLKINY